MEGHPLLFSGLVLLAILIGGMAQLIPAILVHDAVPITHQMKPYTPLELAGRDIYIREGCYNCHTQQVRTLVAETLRYGPYSEAWEYVHDHPFQWGSKRTGPDLHRVGGKYPNLWHYKHMMDPRATSPGSTMPTYAFLAQGKVDFSQLHKKIALMQKLGVPYRSADVDAAEALANAQAQTIVADLASTGATAAADSELAAIIAYLQRLGKDRQGVDAARSSEKPH